SRQSGGPGQIPRGHQARRQGASWVWAGTRCGMGGRTPSLNVASVTPVGGTQLQSNRSDGGGGAPAPRSGGQGGRESSGSPRRVSAAVRLESVTGNQKVTCQVTPAGLCRDR